MDHSVKATRDLRELRAIHRNLFCDVYDWAGQRRTVDVRKNVEGAEHFLPVSMIERAAGYAAEQLRDDDMLRGLDRDRFVERLAFHYNQVNTGVSALFSEEISESSGDADNIPAGNWIKFDQF